jgi:hypothetical protein
MSLSQNYNPAQQVDAAIAAGSATPSIAILTAVSAWLRLFSAVIVYVTQAATTPTVTIKIVDANGNVIWQKTFTALVAATTSFLQLGNGMVDNIATPGNQQVGIPVDTLIPPGGKLLVTAVAANAADTIAATINYGN